MGQTAIAESPQSRTWIHIFGAFAIGAVMSVALVAAPGLGKKLRARQMAVTQSGAIVDLKLIASSQEAFYKENGFYTTDLQALKIAPKRVVYKFGFIQPSQAIPERKDIDPSRKDLDALKKQNSNLTIDYSGVTKLKDIDFDRLSSFCQDCTATKESYKAIAAANLDEDPVLGVWTIDEKGNVSHVINDLH